MNIPKRKPSQSFPEESINQQEMILKARKDSVHKGSMFGIIANGGKFSVGSFIIEVVADASDFRTIQIYEAGLGTKPRVQQYMRTKKVVEKVEVYKKPKVQQESLKVDTEIKKEDLF